MRVVVVLVALTACSDDAPASQPVFPVDYASSFVEVRACRASSEHDLNKIRVLADSLAFEPYTTRTGDFPIGATLLKEEYDFADGTCTGDIVQWTVMQKIAGDANGGGWHWQRVYPAGGGGREVDGDDIPRCINCHVECGVPPDGYLGTCTIPP